MKTILQIARLNMLKISALALIVIIQGCSGGDVEEISKSSRLIVSLVDSPADYKEVNVDIQEISLKTNGTTDNDGWIKLADFMPGVYNILEFTGGQELPLANMEFPSGTITQIKIKLGNNNTLTMGDHTSTLLVAGGSSDGFKFNVNEIISDGSTYYYRIDFDAAQSVTKLGKTGQMLLKPVIKLLSESNTGGISGDIIPATKNVLVNVISHNKIVASSYAPENLSKFFVPGIESGTYDISFESSDSHFQKYIRDVKVSVGKITDIGEISILHADD